MDSLDWSKYQHQELGESNSLMTMQPISNTILYNDTGKHAEMISNFNSIQHVQKTTDFPTNLFPQWHERSRNGTGTSSGSAINAAGIFSSLHLEQNFPTINNNMFSQNSLILDSRNAACFDHQQISSNHSISLESLDCLLSGSNTSQTEATSIEDDGISLIFSDCSKSSLWNFSNTPKSNIPITSLSQDSPKPVKNITPPHHHHHHHHTSSQTTSPGDQQDQHATNTNHHHHHHQEPNPTKRKPPETQATGPTKQRKLDTSPDHRHHQETNFHPVPSKNQPNQQKLINTPMSGQRFGQRSTRTVDHGPDSNNNCINFQQPTSSGSSSEPDAEAIAQMKEIIYRAAAFRPVDFAPPSAAGEKPRRKNVRISSDPQTVAARQRRERISERIRALQRLVPGGAKMDTASMLDEAANYLKFLRSQVKALESMGKTKISVDDQQLSAVINSFPVVNYGANSLAFPFPAFGVPTFAAVQSMQQMQQRPFSVQNYSPVQHQSKS